MDDTLKSKILELLDQHRLMTIATNRPDGWPQATTVGYVNEGLTIYFLCSPQSQKAANLARDNRVSLTIDHDVNDPMAITGLSMAALAQPVTDPSEVAKAMNLLVTRYPEYAAFPMPKPEEIAVYRVLPKVISVLDYSKSSDTRISSQFEPRQPQAADDLMEHFTPGPPPSSGFPLCRRLSEGQVQRLRCATQSRIEASEGTSASSARDITAFAEWHES